jgi:hypothetical protein
MARNNSEEEIESKVAELMQDRMEALDKSLHAKYAVTQSQLMEAQHKYSEDATVGAMMRALKQLVLGEEQTAMFEAMSKLAPADMTADKFTRVFQEHSEFIEKKLGELFKRAAAETVGRSREEKDSYMQMLFQRSIDSIQSTGMAKLALTEDQFKGCMIKFGQDPRINAIMLASNERQESFRDTFYQSK